MKVEPMYKVSDWIDDWRKKEELTDRISTYSEGPPRVQTVAYLIHLWFLMWHEGEH